MSFDLATPEGRVAKLRDAAVNRFGCPEKARAFVENAQPAYLGQGRSPGDAASGSESGLNTAMCMLTPVAGA
ncbi:MAG: hypothetical protein AB7E85_03785 [Pseudobdellovibrionaceae bacterium]